jgi:transposase
MGVDRTDDPTGQARRTAARGLRPRGCERDFLCAFDGCQWAALPKDLPPKSTAHSYFMLWEWDVTLERIHHALYVATHEREGREASPTAAIIDSQSANAAQKGAARSTRTVSMRARR